MLVPANSSQANTKYRVANFSIKGKFKCEVKNYHLKEI